MSGLFQRLAQAEAAVGAIAKRPIARFETQVAVDPNALTGVDVSEMDGSVQQLPRRGPPLWPFEREIPTARRLVAPNADVSPAVHAMVRDSARTIQTTDRSWETIRTPQLPSVPMEQQPRDLVHRPTTEAPSVDTTPAAERPTFSPRAVRSQEERTVTGRAPTRPIATSEERTITKPATSIRRTPDIMEVASPQLVHRPTDVAQDPSRSQPPVIEITIGRIEVRSLQPPARAEQPAPFKPAMGLDAYLQRRNEGRS